jgi:HSP20 family protein
MENLPLRPDANRSGDKVIIRIDVPGGDPESLAVRVVGRFLTIKGSREENQESQHAQDYLHETRYGEFEQTLQSREGVKADDLKATHQNGILELTATLPKKGASKEVKVHAHSMGGGRGLRLTMSGCCASQMHLEYPAERRFSSFRGRLAASKPSEHEREIKREQVVGEKRRIDIGGEFAAFLGVIDQYVQLPENRLHYGIDALVFALHERELPGENTSQPEVALVFLQHDGEDVRQLIDQWALGDLAEGALDTPAHLLLEHHHEQGFLGLRVKKQRAFCDVG